MFKKLQNLLFEDEEENIANEAPQVAPQVEPVKPVVHPQQIVTPVQPQPVAPVVIPTAPVEPVAVAPVAPVVKVEEVKKPSLGITVDDDVPVEKKKPVKPVAKPVVPAKKEETPASYQFRPVISPIFGVDEKDVNSLKNTTNKIKKAQKPKNEANVTPVLSPMYGMSKESSLLHGEEIDEVIEESEVDSTTTAKEDDIPEFSLDDILKVRDREFNEDDRSVKEDDAPDFPDLTFDDDDAPEVPEEEEDIPSDLPVNEPETKLEDSSNIDNTVIIKQQLFDDDEN